MYLYNININFISSKVVFCSRLVFVSSIEFRLVSRFTYDRCGSCDHQGLLFQLLVIWVEYKLAVASKNVCVYLSEMAELGHHEVEKGALLFSCLLDEPKFLIDGNC